MSSDDIEIEDCDCAVEVRPNELLAVAGHHALTGCEVLWVEDRGGDDEWNVWSVDVAGLEVGAALVADEDLVPWEVGVLVDCEAVRERADLLAADRHWRGDLALAVECVGGAVVHRCLEDRRNIGTDNDEVGGAAKRLPVDLVGDVDDRLDERLVPLADRAGEGGAGLDGGARDLGACCLVHEATGCAAPEEVSTGSGGEEVVEDLAVELHGDLLGEDLRELNLSVEAVVRVEVLSKLGGPLRAELTSDCGHCDRLDLDVDLGDHGAWCRSEVRLEAWDRES